MTTTAVSFPVPSHAARLHESTPPDTEQRADALVLLAAGGFEPEAVGAGWDRVQALVLRMDDRRRARLGALGFDPERAAALSALHTRNFM